MYSNEKAYNGMRSFMDSDKGYCIKEMSVLNHKIVSSKRDIYFIIQHKRSIGKVRYLIPLNCDAGDLMKALSKSEISYLYELKRKLDREVYVLRLPEGNFPTEGRTKIYRFGEHRNAYKWDADKIADFLNFKISLPKAY